MENFLCIFEKYQTFFTGLLGFTGVILTMIVNARHQTAIQERKLAHETQALRLALKAELTANKNAFENRIEQLDKQTDFSLALMPNSLIDNVSAKESALLQAFGFHVPGQQGFQLLNGNNRCNMLEDVQ